MNKARPGKRHAGGAAQQWTATAVLMAVLTACGGGGGNAEPDGPATPPGIPSGTGLTGGSHPPAPPAPQNPTDPPNSQPSPAEFRINRTSEGAQGHAAGAALAGGGFVAVWTSAPEGGHGDVRTKLFDAQGQPAGSEIVVAEQGRSPEVVALADGGFLVTWWANPFALEVHGYAQRFDAAGAAVGGPVQVGAASNMFVPRPAASSGGGFVLAADVAQSFGPSRGRVSRHAADGSLLGTPTVLVSDVSPPTGAQDPNWVRGTVAGARSDGSFSVAWVAGGTNVSELRLTHFDAQGQALGTEAVMTDALLQEPAITLLPGGKTVLAWVSGVDAAKALHVQLRDAEGGWDARFSMDIQADAAVPRLAPTADGGFVLAWKATRYQGDTVQSSASALRFDAAGQPIGTPEQIGAVSAPASAPVVDHDSIDVLGLGDGAFVVLHGSYTQETGWDVHGARR